MAQLRIPVDENDHSTGKAGASIILVEYGDYQCSHCGDAYPLVKKLIQQFSQELNFVFRNFPLQEAHPEAMMAAQAAEAAALQHKFWEMHDLIYENQNDLDRDNLIYLAETLDLNTDKFLKDWNNHLVTSKIENDLEGGMYSGVNGTPTFFINGKRLDTYNETYQSLSNAIFLAK